MPNLPVLEATESEVIQTPPRPNESRALSGAERTGGAEPSARSWPFRFAAAAARFSRGVFGLLSMWVLLAVAANIPILQFAAFGYLLESSGRIARSGQLRSGLFGLRHAARMGGWVAGTWLCLLPVRFLSDFWYSAWLLDPHSVPTARLRIALVVVAVLTAGHVLAAFAVGGRLRHFLWPLCAPFQVAGWALRRSLSWPFVGPAIDRSVGRLAPNFVYDLRHSPRLDDWFLPLVFWKLVRRGRWMDRAADAIWEFGGSLRLPELTWLGFRAGLASLIWLALPSWLLIAATGRADTGGVLLGLAGACLATLAFSTLLFQQTQFAASRKWRDFWNLRLVFRAFRKAPLWHWLAAVLALVFALPLFLLKIEEVPRELLWILSLLFVAFSWPSRIALGYAAGRAGRREVTRAWWWAYPLAILIVPVCFAFVVVFFFTQYVSWNGPLSLLENHVFLLPAPFWLARS